jgi:hypothetical protein
VARLRLARVIAPAAQDAPVPVAPASAPRAPEPKIPSSSSLSPPVNYATEDGSATAGSDYSATSGGIQFNAGSATRLVSVPISGDTDVEPDETLTLNLSKPKNGATADGLLIATIRNDD